ncbi:MAG: DUF4390 domain-containing protein [Burkholderiaceae bacterium]
MHCAARHDDPVRAGAPWRAAGSVAKLMGLVVLLAALLCTASARAAELELNSFDLVSGDDGVYLSYGVNLELPRSVDEALSKAVPLFFVAEAEVFRSRFYWRDQRVGYAVRRWRIVFQPLTATYRVTFDGGLSQNYVSRAEAFDAIGRSSRWKIAEAAQIEAGRHHYLEFSYRLDTSQLPRPMQIGIGGQSDWSMSAQRNQSIN